MKYIVQFTETVAYQMEIEASSPEEAASKGAALVEADQFDTSCPDRQEGSVAAWSPDMTGETALVTVK